MRIDIMAAPNSKITIRTSYNLTAFSLYPRYLDSERRCTNLTIMISEVVKIIQEVIPDFVIGYSVDPVRQKIADSWPDSIDDAVGMKNK